MDKYQSKSITPVDDYVCTLSKELKELAKNELRETDEVRRNAIKALRDWVMSNPRIIKTRLDSVWLLKFLRFRKFSIPMAQEAIERYLVLKEGSYGNIWFHDLNIKKPSIDKLLDEGYIFVLAKRDSLGRRIVFTRASVLDAHSPTVGCDIMTIHTLVYDVLMQDEENQIRGVVHVADVAGLQPSHFTIFSPKYSFRIGKNTEKTLPMRHKAFHVVNLHPSVKFISVIVLANISEKLKNRVKMYSKFEDMTAVHKDNLPAEYGGKVPIKDLVKSIKKELHASHELHLRYTEMKVNSEMYSPQALEGSAKSLKYPLNLTELTEKKCHDNYSWVSSSVYSQPPHNAVLAGHDSDRSPLYVGRAMEGCATIPAKVIPCKQACYVSFNGNEILKHNFEYLVGSGFQWVASSNGQIPSGAVVAGNDQSGEVHYVVCGETLYIGRGQHCGSLTVGKIHPSHGCLYIPFGGSEIAIKNYEVLVEH
ncbi:unnamed protein product [Diamesa hyperborea]